MTIAAIIAVPFVLAIAILAWCLCRAARLSDEAAAEALRRYREYEGDEAIEWLTAQQIIDRYRAYAGLPLEERDDDVRG